MPQYLSPGVYIEEIPGARPIEAAGTSVAAFVGFTERRPVGNNGEPHLVTNWTQFSEEFGGFVAGAYLPLAVYGYFLNGGGICYIQSIATAEELSRKGSSKASKPLIQLPAKNEALGPALRVESQASGAVTLQVEDPAPGSPDDTFKISLRGPHQAEESFDNLTLNRGRGVRNAVEVINRESKLVRLQEIESAAPLAERRPAAGSYSIEAPVTTAITPTVSKANFEGDLTARVGLAGLESVDEVTMVCMPDLMASHLAGNLSRDDVKALQTALINHCERMKDRVAILDPLPDATPQQILDWRMKEAGYDSSYAALYYPWIWVANPLANGSGNSLIKVPPSGHLAGLYARVDGERGVHKAPANEVLRGAVKLERQVTKGEQDLLNPKGINCIRAFPGRGIRVWGARTLASDGAWRYINVRRLFCMVEESVFEGTQWAVFEPNDYSLWARIKRDISSFLTRVWLDGALFGATADEAFYVKCDAELNPPAVRDAGQLIIEVGIAPVKPAEFVVIRFKQLSGDEA